jgi:hypothetical protein
MTHLNQPPTTAETLAAPGGRRLRVPKQVPLVMFVYETAETSAA